VDSAYLLRHIKEFPKWMYKKEREEGYPLIVIRLEHYTKLRPEAECGRHRAYPPDPHFNPMKFIKKHLSAKQLSDFPQMDLARFEAKVSAIAHISEERSRTKWPRFDDKKLKENSLWYYPSGHAQDYGINERRDQRYWGWLQKPKHLVLPASPYLQQEFPLEYFLNEEEFSKVLSFLDGEPLLGFSADQEPGNDVLRLSDVTSKYFYTSGVDHEPIYDVYGDVSNREHFSLVGISIQPYVMEEDILFEEPKVIPQVRLVYQLMDPRNLERPLEQLYLHLNYDAIDRLGDSALQDAAHIYFLNRIDELSEAKESNAENYPELLAAFLEEFTKQPIENLAFSSSLTGIWIFGALTRTNNLERDLKPVRIIREGIDIGYYSSSYDNDLFREALKTADGPYKQRLEEHLEALTPSTYRDPKRNDVHQIRFDRMTCSQCHQMSGRDAVHMSLNDKIDSRFKGFSKITEFVYREADRQLEFGQSYWQP